MIAEKANEKLSGILEELKDYQTLNGFMLGTKDGDKMLIEYKRSDFICDSSMFAPMSATAYGAAQLLDKKEDEPDIVHIKHKDGSFSYIVGTKRCVLLVCASKPSSDLEEKILEIREEIREKEKEIFEES